MIADNSITSELWLNTSRKVDRWSYENIRSLHPKIDACRILNFVPKHLTSSFSRYLFFLFNIYIFLSLIHLYLHIFFFSQYIYISLSLFLSINLFSSCSLCTPDFNCSLNLCPNLKHQIFLIGGSFFSNMSLSLLLSIYLFPFYHHNFSFFINSGVQIKTSNILG